MRSFAIAAIIALATTNALALEDCGRSSGEGEINRRLDCLQRNNEELANHVGKLHDMLKHALRDDSFYSIQASDGIMCLAGDTSGNAIRRCTEVRGAKFRFRP